MSKRGYPLQNIDVRAPGKEQGKIVEVTGVMFLVMLCIFLLAQLQIDTMQMVSAETEDALAASNLASAIIDIEEYGGSHKLRIKDAEMAYELYCEALKSNLGLDENWVHRDKILISGRVRIERYIVYNVHDGIVEAEEVQDGRVLSSTGMLGSVEAPNGVLVESTGVYSEISFPVRGFLGMEQETHKGKLVDIVGGQNEEK